MVLRKLANGNPLADSTRCSEWIKAIKAPRPTCKIISTGHAFLSGSGITGDAYRTFVEYLASDPEVVWIARRGERKLGRSERDYTPRRQLNNEGVIILQSGRNS